MNRPIRLLAMLLLLPALQGCGIFVTLDGWVKMEKSMPDKTSVLVIPAPQLERGDGFQAQVDKFALMALFAKVVYRLDLPEASRSEQGCRHLDGESVVFGMPRHTDGSGWERLSLKQAASAGQPEVVSCYDRHGLYFETYIHKASGAEVPDVAVIAIRGTENYNLYQRLKDWSSNFAAMLGFDPAEYAYAREMALPLLASLKANHPDIQIYVTGHSLGGGIAQQLAYASKEVQAAYVFDSSPVTNWSHMMSMKPSPIKNHNPLIYRVNHTNEFLQGPRMVATRLTATRLHRSDYEFFFQKSGLVNDHEMGILACNLAVRISDKAAFDFPKTYVRAVQESPEICPGKLGKYNPDLIANADQAADVPELVQE